jgi:hypothetical protein
MPRPDLRIASTMEKLDCSVFSAATAACACQLSSHTRVCLAYRIVALLHFGRAVVETSGWCNARIAQASPGYEHKGIISLMPEERCVTFVCQSPPIADDASDGARASSPFSHTSNGPSILLSLHCHARQKIHTPGAFFFRNQPRHSYDRLSCIIPTLSNGIKPNALSLWFRETQHDIRNVGYASNHSVPEEKAYPMVRNITRSFMALFRWQVAQEKNTVVVLFDTSL